MRGEGIGRQLFKIGIDFAQSKNPKKAIKISAQTYLQKFYASFGFKVSSTPYDEDGIEHIDMIFEKA